MNAAAPETPWVIAGIGLTVGAFKKQGGMSKSVYIGAAASIGLIIIASLSAGTQFAAVVRAVGILFALSTAAYVVNAFTEK